MRFDMRVEGFESVTAMLEGLEDQLIPAMARGMDRGTQQIADIAKDIVHVRSGELRDSISADPAKADGNTVIGRVKATAEHAVYEEMGTGERGAANPPEGAIETGATYATGHPGQEAHPYMYPAMQQGEQGVRDAIIEEIKGVIGG